MRSHTYFTAEQQAVCKQLLPAAIISTIISLYTSTHKFEHLHVYYISGIQFALIFALEQFFKKNWSRAIIIAVGYFLTHILIRQLNHVRDPRFLFFTWNCLQVIGICYISGKKAPLRTGLVAGVLIASTYYRTEISKFMIDPFAAIYSFAAVYMIPTWIYLAENANKQLLASKVQSITGREYQLLFGVFSVTFWCIFTNTWRLFHDMLMTRFFSQIFEMHEPIALLLTLLISGYLLYKIAQLIRNIVISRMLSTASFNPWMYLLHYIPVLNIIPWIIYSRKTTIAHDNESYYLSRPPHYIGYLIIMLGMLFTIMRLWKGYTMLPDHNTVLIFIFMILLFTRIILYGLLSKGNKHIILALVIINAITGISAGFYGRAGLPLFLIALLGSTITYYFLIEIFSPSLDKA